MLCPYCSHTASRVTDKRASVDSMRRRRECLKCKKRFTTYEKVDRGDLWVVKKNGSRQKFDVEKITAGIQRAFQKRHITQEKINKMVHEIEDKIRRMGKKEIKSSAIGELAMKKIKKYDDVAYIRFASIYKDFQSIEDFKEAIGGLK
jgi:transcriptional repressor NrdR